MNERTVANAVATWLEDLDGPADLKAYAYPISNTTGPLPDAVVLVSEKNVTDQIPDDFPDFALEQVWARLYSVEVSIMTEIAEQTEASADQADAEVREFGAVIEEAVWDDASLGGMLEGGACSPRLRFDYSTPFVAREGGTKGRFVVITLAIAEPIPDPG